MSTPTLPPLSASPAREALVNALIDALRSCSRDQQRRVHAALGLFLERA
jgi:hypothetical protein